MGLVRSASASPPGVFEKGGDERAARQRLLRLLYLRSLPRKPRQSLFSGWGAAKAVAAGAAGRCAIKEKQCRQRLLVGGAPPPAENLPARR